MKRVAAFAAGLRRPLVSMTLLLAATFLNCAEILGAEIAIGTPRLRLTFDDKAVCQSLQDKASGGELIAKGVRLPIAVVGCRGRSFPAASAVQQGKVLVLRFAGTDTVLHYRVEPTDDWVVFRLEAIGGTRPENLTMLRVPVAITENVGRRLGGAWNKQVAACLMAANRQVDCRAESGSHATLVAVTQDVPGPRLEGSAVALIVCPTAQFKAIARKASHAFGLLTNEDAVGVPVKDTPSARGSYWFLSFAEGETDKVIEYCQRAGVRQVMLASTAWCKSPGHYLFDHVRYPRGRDSLKDVVDRLHRHGILVGMHCFASKISKQDPYVAPVPDRRLLRGVSAAWRIGDAVLEALLAAPVTAEETTIRTSSDLRWWPGSPMTADRYWEGGVLKHQQVLVGQELVRYSHIGPEGKWDTFFGCQRGAYGTRAVAHPAGATACHLAVDGCIDGFLIDQETDLIDEVADRLADIFNYCGFDMIYFDGGEDVDRRRFNYYVSNFQEQVMRRITKRPILHMGTIMTHNLWHSFARSSTVDHYLNTMSGAIIAGRPPQHWPTVKQHIDRSVQYMLSVRQDMMPGELGWFGIWPAGKQAYTVHITPDQCEQYRAIGCDKGPVSLPGADNMRITGELLAPERLRLSVEYDGLQLDEVEYLMCKSLAYDAPVSLQTGFAQLEAHRLTPAILQIVNTYETLRLSGTVPEHVRQMLSQSGKDFALLRWRGKEKWVEVKRADAAGGDRQLRVFVGALDDASVAVLWHEARQRRLLIPLDPKQIELLDIAGRSSPVQGENGVASVPVGLSRCAAVCKGVRIEELRRALGSAELRFE